MVTDTRTSDAAPNGHGPGGRGPAVDPEQPTPRPPDAWQPLWKSLDELREYVAYYLTVQADRVRLQIRRAVLWAIVGLVAGLAGATLVVTAVVLVLDGAGGGLGELLGGRVWLGNLIVGLAVLAATAIALASLYYGVQGAFRQKIIGKYDSRRATQRRRFGQDIGSRN